MWEQTIEVKAGSKGTSQKASALIQAKDEDLNLDMAGL